MKKGMTRLKVSIVSPITNLLSATDWSRSPQELEAEILPAQAARSFALQCFAW